MSPVNKICRLLRGEFKICLIYYILKCFSKTFDEKFNNFQIGDIYNYPLK